MGLLWIPLILLILVILTLSAGFLLLDFTCGRRKHEDPWSDRGIHARGLDAIRNEILTGKKWLDGQSKEEISVRSFDGLLIRALFVSNPEADGTLLLFHGWRSTWKTDFIVSVPFYYSQGMNLLLVDQRAQNSSEGRYMTFGVRESRDVGTWIETMAQRLGRDHPIYLGGLSMGASTVLMASDREYNANVRGIIADCGFTSPRAIIRSVAGRIRWIPLNTATAFLGFFTKHFAGFGLDEKDSRETLRQTTLPVLLFHGLADNFVPASMSQENYDACVSEKEMLLVEGAAHGMSYVVEPDRVKELIADFLKKHISENNP